MDSIKNATIFFVNEDRESETITKINLNIVLSCLNIKDSNRYNIYI